MIKPPTPFLPDTEGVFFGLPNDVYRKAPGVSQSELKEFGEHGSPLHFSVRQRKKATEDMEFGTVCHTAVLEPEKLGEAYYVKPDKYPATVKGKKGEPDSTVMKDWTGQADFCIKWKAEHSGRPIITKEKEERIPKIVERVKRLPEFGDALRNGNKEVSFFKRDELTGLLLKCRADLVATEAGHSDGSVMWLFDLKKVQSGEASPEAFSKQADNFGYHVQAASYLFITGASHFVFVPFDDDVPFDACQFEPDEEMLSVGIKEYRRLLDLYAQCVRANDWPGYRNGINKLKLPPYAVKRETQAQHAAWQAKVLLGGGL